MKKRIADGIYRNEEPGTPDERIAAIIGKDLIARNEAEKMAREYYDKHDVNAEKFVDEHVKFTYTGDYYERPWIDGKRTWRSLDTQNLKHAKEELARRKAGVKGGRNSGVTAGDVIGRYLDDGTPDSHRQKRPEGTKEKEVRFCGNLISFWDKIDVSKITNATCDRYCDHRVAKIKKESPDREGTRAVDLDLNTLSNAFDWANFRSPPALDAL